MSNAAYGPMRGEAMRMEDVPPIVFSEVMRHCDLFTSVASVANDPNWADAGAEAQHPNQWRRNEGNAYWRDAALGDLSQSASTRREVVEAILPSLKIADRCRVDGNFLHVNGKIRSYKIHFGSGNIMMEPDHRYICIVPASRETGGVMLPFEGDAMLSTILSKALLLAEDDEVHDQVIVRQIYR